jgi:hypothetical protein
MKKLLSTLAIAVAGSCSYAQTFNPTSQINATGAADAFKGGYTFAYTPSGSPWYGAFMSFGGFSSNSHDSQISTDYGPNGGKHISFRTRNGDIGIWNPWYELWNSSNLNNSSSDFIAQGISANGIQVKSSAYSTLQGFYLGWNKSGSLGEANLVSNIGGGSGGFTFDNTTNGTAFTRLMTITGSGNVGIGTADTKGYKLAVTGSVIAESMKVKLQGSWPDYVFRRSYNLPTLTHIKAYIDKNQHLPDMPSEAEVAKEGINLGEIVKIQTKKIEELTLYLIEEHEKNAVLEARMKALEAKLQDK